MDFPGRLQHVLAETIDNVVVECIVFPAYETKGELVRERSYVCIPVFGDDRLNA